MQKHSFDQFPVRDAENKLIGVVTSTLLMSKLLKNKVVLSDPLSKIVLKEYRDVSSSIPLHELGRVLSRNAFVIVDNKYIASNFDLLNFMKLKE